MLNKKSQALLSDLSTISTAAVLKYPITAIQDPSKSMIAFVDLSEFGEDEFENYGIFNLPEFLSVVNIVDDANIDMEDGVINISNDKMSIKYYTTNIDLLEETYSANPQVLTNISKAPQVGNFKLDINTLDKLKKTSGLMKLGNLVISSNNNEIGLEITDTNTSSSNSFKIALDDSNSDEDFNIVLKMDLLKNLPTGAYNTKIMKNPKTGSYITLFSSIDIPSLEIVILVIADE